MTTDKNNDKGLTPHELIKKHISDKEHTVSDDEIKNLKVGEEAKTEDELRHEIEEKEGELKNLPNTDDFPDPYEVVS